MGCDQESFIILILWGWHQLLSGSLPNGCMSWVSHRLGQEFFTLPLYTELKFFICYQMLKFLISSNCISWQLYDGHGHYQLIAPVMSTCQKTEFNNHPVCIGVTCGQYADFLANYGLLQELAIKINSYKKKFRKLCGHQFHTLVGNFSSTRNWDSITSHSTSSK